VTGDQYVGELLANYAVPRGQGSPSVNALGVVVASLWTWANKYLSAIGPSGSFAKGSRRGERWFVAAQRLGSVRIVPNAGHACSLDQPEIYNQAIREFAESIGWSAAKGPSTNSKVNHLLSPKRQRGIDA
jgi:pimeloyl-ACP methyl ester carboxylesterase